MTFDNNNSDEHIMRFMEESASQEAQLQRGYDRMAFIAGAVIGLITAAQSPTNLGAWIALPLLFGGFFVFVRKASSR